MQLDPDRALIETCRDLSSDEFEPAFETLYNRYKDHVYNVAYRITGNAADAMDVTQETFGLLLRKIDRFEFNSRFSSWLYRIVVNLSIDWRRRNRLRRSQSIHDDGEDLGQEPCDERAVPPVEALQRMELSDAVQAGIGGLSPKLRAIVVLRYLQDLSYEQLAETLEVSVGTVKSRLARAHLALERIFGNSLSRFGATAFGAANSNTTAVSAAVAGAVTAGVRTAPAAKGGVVA
jgi:RNA polymerase sigma-70 factor (ECF subfamily)